MNESRSIVIRGSRIFEDAHGHICLDDLWRAAKAKPSKEPSRWRTTRPAIALIDEMQKKTVLSGLKENRPDIPVIYALRGRGKSGTYAHPILAAAYAGFLSPKLEIEVREVWLRYRAGDATLADDILQRATAEANRWAGARAVSRSQRVAFTDTLKAAYVTGRGYMDCTEAVYLKLLGAKSYQLREARGLAPKENIRNNLSIAELSFVMAAEALAAERIDQENRLGNDECIDASGKSASAIRQAIESDRKDRQKRLSNI
ncbi:KilA-N domain-containing protein [Bradyrhizobium sp. AUGA SZCCT0431]|uniref:KilA-N domain-containing protein n=1 Tax=Bradyrhizobium sp. AUGA SZCCT0431 TaxID=2807674 RepID=UPI001BACBBC0|nr:KilA-N domain-containing protein [Bradyrhizobium sp. AUGA SZCCT0431]MBR1146360.1 KilA-N domain-containing protein [Bradyrhizobium sp. AUGA SZCCT0431]